MNFLASKNAKQLNKSKLIYIFFYFVKIQPTQERISKFPRLMQLLIFRFYFDGYHYNL